MIDRRGPASTRLIVPLLCAVSACSGSVDGAANGVGVQVSPASAYVLPGSSVNFTAVVTGTANTTVSWSVTQAGGGTIDATGNYFAPQALGTYNVVAASAANPSVTSSASVTVTLSPPTSGTCADVPLRSTGTIYYYCDCGTGASAGCTPGNDANAGTSPSAPRRSWSSALGRMNALQAGDTVAFCRTGAWAAGQFHPTSTTCRGGSNGWPPPDANTDTCDMRDYVPAWGNASSPRPLFTNFQPAFWNGSPGGWRFWNLDWRAQPDNNAVYLESVDYFDFCNVNVESMTPLGCCSSGCGAASHADSAFTTAGPPSQPGYISIRNSRFAHFSFHGLNGGNRPGTTFLVESTLWENNGNRNSATNVQCENPPAQNHQWYLYGASSGTFRNNEIVSDGRYCGGNMMGNAGDSSDIAYTNNYVHVVGSSTAATFGGCGAWSTGPTASAALHLNYTFTRNRVRSDYWGVGLSCTNGATITDNIVIGGVDIGQNDGGNCSGSTQNITAMNNSVYGDISVLNTTGNTLRNNAVYNGGGACFTNVGGSVSRDHNNCVTGTPSAAWVSPGRDLNTADFTPVNPGPLIGTANQSLYSARAIGTVLWDPADTGVARAQPIDMGARVP